MLTEYCFCWRADFQSGMGAVFDYPADVKLWGRGVGWGVGGRGLAGVRFSVMKV